MFKNYLGLKLTRKGSKRFNGSSKSGKQWPALGVGEKRERLALLQPRGLEKGEVKLRLRLQRRACWQAGAGVSEGGALRPGLQGMEKLQTGSDATPKRSSLCWDEKHHWQDTHRDGKYIQVHRKENIHPVSLLQPRVSFGHPRCQRVAGHKCGLQSTSPSITS